MNLAYACLVFLACICFARGAAGDLIESVECDEKGKLTATIDTSYWSSPTSASCASDSNTNVQIGGTGNTLVLTGCPMGNNVVFTVTHHNAIADGPVAITADQDELSVTLRCDAIQSNTHFTADLGGLTFIGTHSVTPISKITTENIEMVMELRSHGDNSPTTSMNLGATYDLLIAGAGSHDTVVTKCTAAGSANATEVTIFPSSEHVAVLSNFTTYSGTKNTIGEKKKKINKEATLTGFRLVGSPTVYLTCTIDVCAGACTSSPDGSSSDGSSSSVSSSAGSSAAGSSSTGSSSAGSSSPDSSSSGSSTKRSSSVKSKRSSSAKSSIAKPSPRKRSKHPTVVHYARLKLDVRDNSENRAENGATGTIPVGNHMMRLIFLITIMKFLF